MPINSTNRSFHITGALKIQITVNKLVANCLIDTGSGISFLSKTFTEENGWPIINVAGPTAATINGELIKITSACDVEIEILGERYTSHCSIIDNIAFDILVGMDLLNNTDFILDFGSKLLINPRTCQSAGFEIFSSKLSPTMTCVADQSETKLNKIVTVKTESTKKVSQNEQPTLDFPEETVFVNNESTGIVAVDDEDGLIDKEEMWLPIINKREKTDLLEDSVQDNPLKNLDINPELLSNQREQILALLNKYPEIIPTKQQPLGCCKLEIEHTIDTGDHKPVRQQMRRFSPWQIQEIQRQVEEMYNLGVIDYCDSEWNTNFVLVKKKTGETRICQDLREVNNITVNDLYPMPRIQDLLDRLKGSAYYSTFDLVSGYHQIKMSRQDWHKTAFIVPGSNVQMAYLRMPFGLKNAPATFCKMMDIIFHDVQNFALYYLDDLNAFSPTFENHLLHLEKIFLKLKNAGLKIKLSKCSFGYTKITFLGHEVSKEGIMPDKKKTEAVKNFAVPANLKQLRCFLRLCSYFRKFMPRFATIAYPL